MAILRRSPGSARSGSIRRRGPCSTSAARGRPAVWKKTLTRGGFRYARLTLYEAVAADRLPEAAAAALRGGEANAVALFSPRSARIFASLARKAGLAPALATVDAWCLSGAVAAAAGARWRRVVVSPRPRADCLSELMAESARSAAAKLR